MMQTFHGPRHVQPDAKDPIACRDMERQSYLNDQNCHKILTKRGPVNIQPSITESGWRWLELIYMCTKHPAVFSIYYPITRILGTSLRNSDSTQQSTNVQHLLLRLR